MPNNIKQLRKKIQKIDRNIIQLVSSRLGTAQKIGRLKIKAKLPIIDKAYENYQEKVLKKLALKHKVSRILILDIYKSLIKESKRLQRHDK